jgi:RHS repeat-associated protein
MGYLGAWERPSDPSSGMIQMGVRSYAPSLGAFASEDPVLGHLGIGVSANRYPYAWDNPLNRYDLNGRDVCVPTPFGSACADDAWDSTAPGRQWTSDRAHDFEKFASQNWDTAVIGTATVGVGAVTVFATGVCIGGTEGLGTIECLKGASVGYTATVGGVYATIESTKN